MDPISGLAIAGGATMLYNMGSYLYNYMYPEDDITNEDIKQIEKELIEESHNNVLEQVHKIKESYDIDYEDVICELEQLFKYRNNDSDDDTESDSSEELYMSGDTSSTDEEDLTNN